MPAKVIDRVALRASLFPRLGYFPHKGQRAVHNSPARHRVASCGRRFGKSYLGGYDLVQEAVATRLLLPVLEAQGRRREFWIIGPEYTDAEKEFRYMYDALVRAGVTFDRPGTYNNPHGGDMQVSLFGGRFLVKGKSAKHPETLVGEGLNGVVLAEAAKIKASTWTKFVRPMLADYNGWSLHTSTPEGKNWFYDSWMKGQSEFDPDWESWRMPSWRNPHVYPMGASAEGLVRLRYLMDDRQMAITSDVMRDLGVDPEVGALMKDLTRETFNGEIAADFTEFVGRVFKDFDEEIHVKDFGYNPAWPVYAACDYGFTNPFVWLLIQVDEFGTVYVLDEMYERGLTIDEAGQEVIRRGLRPAALQKLYPDPASPGDTRALERILKVQGQGGTGGELNVRLRMIRAALKERNTHLEPGHPDRKPKLVINRKCTKTIFEMNNYRYPQTAEEAAERGNEPAESPKKVDDHTPEALGRFFAGTFAVPEQGVKRRARVTTARVA